MPNDHDTFTLRVRLSLAADIDIPHTPIVSDNDPGSGDVTEEFNDDHTLGPEEDYTVNFTFKIGKPAATKPFDGKFYTSHAERVAAIQANRLPTESDKPPLGDPSPHAHGFYPTLTFSPAFPTQGLTSQQVEQQASVVKNGTISGKAPPANTVDLSQGGASPETKHTQHLSLIHI